MIGSENENALALDNVAGIREQIQFLGRAEVGTECGGRGAADGKREYEYER
jgi:hypothetical protein